MRLIGTVDTEKQAFTFYSVLLKEGIHATYEPFQDPEEKKERLRIWIYEEDEVDHAIEMLEKYMANPDSPEYSDIQMPAAPPEPPNLTMDQQQEGEQKKEEQIARPWQKRAAPSPPKKKRSYPITYGLILLCVFLYILNGMQQVKMLKADGRLGLQLGLTPIQQTLMFDYPAAKKKVDSLLEKYSIESAKQLDALPKDQWNQFQQAIDMPTWKGGLPYLISWIKKIPPPASGPLFEEIREGEVWRLFTPCLLHGGLLHILFNMAWAWILLRPVEERLSFIKLILLVLIIGIVANVAQYFVSGPMFLGFSGVICGLVGFIWVRQKVAPWEGYPIQKSTFIFVLVFIGAMFALELFTLGMAIFSSQEISVNIANTAHIIGGLTGALLGRVPFFARSNHERP